MTTHKRGIFEAQQPHGPGWYRIWGKRGEQVNSIDMNKGDIPDLIVLLEAIQDKEEETSMPPGLTGEDMKLLIEKGKAENTPWPPEYSDEFMGDSSNRDDMTTDCLLPTDDQRLAELEEAVANLLIEMEVLRGKNPLTKPRLLVCQPRHREEAERILEVGIVQGLQSSCAVLREQVRELVGDVERLKSNQNRQILCDNATTMPPTCFGPYQWNGEYPRIVWESVTGESYVWRDGHWVNEKGEHYKSGGIHHV